MAAERPRITVFTVVLQGRHFEATLESLLAQTLPAWEWIVVAPSGRRWLPSRSDRRMRLIVEDSMAGDGARRRLACGLALSGLLVELEEGAELASTALERMVATFDSHPEVGLVYGGGALLDELGAPNLQQPDPALGWIYQPASVDGRELLVVEAMDPTPHNVSLSWFGPRFGRAFRRSVYEQAGGHDASREQIGNEELVCRMFLHAEFLRLDGCLALERPKDSASKEPAEPDATANEIWALYDHSIAPNALAWAKRRRLTALDIGPAAIKQPGYLGVGTKSGPGVDVLGSLEDGLQVPDSSVGVVRAADVLPYVADTIAAFNELYRVLAPGGILFCSVPSTDGRGAFQDPGHVSRFNENSFWYFTNQEFSRFVPQIRCRFQVSRLLTFYPTDWHIDHDVPYVLANLIATKDGSRNGGLLHV